VGDIVWYGMHSGFWFLVSGFTNEILSGRLRAQALLPQMNESFVLVLGNNNRIFPRVH
jgi:hypothetical protein